MNRISLTTTIAGLLAFLSLWLMIMIDSDDLSWLSIGLGEPPAAPVAKSPVEPASVQPVLSCEETENSLRDRIGTARYCTTDGDCTLFDYGYPIDCMMSVAKSEITALRIEYRKYEQSCKYRVYFDCPAEPMVRRAVCQENRCSVSLQTIDNLEDETLKYLGIRGSEEKK
jgi:hypothetical protein